jgi:hypothetical protein
VGRGSGQPDAVATLSAVLFSYHCFVGPVEVAPRGVGSHLLGFAAALVEGTCGKECEERSRRESSCVTGALESAHVTSVLLPCGTLDQLRTFSQFPARCGGDADALITCIFPWVAGLCGLMADVCSQVRTFHTIAIPLICLLTSP